MPFLRLTGGEQSGFTETQGVVAYQNGPCYNAVRQLEFDEQIRTAPKAPSDEGAVTEGDWGRENYPSVSLFG